MIKKFPVTSESGNEYLVKIYKGCMIETNYEVRVYEQYKGWFGITRYRYLNDFFMHSARYYDIREFNFNLAEMAKYEIARMEAEWEAEKQLKHKLNIAEQEFEKWNGDCI